MRGLNKNRIIGDTIIYSIGEIVPRVFSFLLLPILTHCLSTADYGISSYTTTVMTFVFVICSLSLNTFLLRNYYVEKNEEDKKLLVGSIFLFICLFNVILFVVQLLVIPGLLTFWKINIPFFPFFLLAICNNFFDVISIIPLVVCRVKENAAGFLIISLTRIILQFVLTYIMVVVYKTGLMGSYLARLYINIPFLFVYVYVIYKNGYFRINWSRIKQALSFSVPFLPASLSYLVISMSDRVILERYITLDQLGIYSVAFTLALALNIIIQALYKTFEQVIFKNYASEQFNAINENLYKIYSLLITTGGLFIALYSQEVFKVAAAASFNEGHRLVPFMVVTVIVAGFNTYLSTLLIAANRQKVISLLTFIAAVVSIGLNFLLVPRYGYYGSICSSIVSVLIISIGSCIKLSLFNRISIYQIVSLCIIPVIGTLISVYPVSKSMLVVILFKAGIILAFMLGGAKILQLDIKPYIVRFKAFSR